MIQEAELVFAQYGVIVFRGSDLGEHFDTTIS